MTVEVEINSGNAVCQFADKEMDRAAHVETPVVLVVQASYSMCVFYMKRP